MRKAHVEPITNKCVLNPPQFAWDTEGFYESHGEVFKAVRYSSHTEGYLYGWNNWLTKIKHTEGE